jgi:hypothetical protein
MKRYYVMVSAPELPTRVVACPDVEQCIDVVQGEEDSAPTGAIINMMAIERGAVVPVARWTITKHGKLKRGRPARRNPGEHESFVALAGDGHQRGASDDEVRELLVANGASPTDADCAICQVHVDNPRRRPRVQLADLGPKWDANIKALVVGGRWLGNVRIRLVHIDRTGTWEKRAYAETVPLDARDQPEFERALKLVNRRFKEFEINRTKP